MATWDLACDYLLPDAASWFGRVSAMAEMRPYDERGRSPLSQCAAPMHDARLTRQGLAERMPFGTAKRIAPSRRVALPRRGCSKSSLVTYGGRDTLPAYPFANMCGAMESPKVLSVWVWHVPGNAHGGLLSVYAT